MQALENLYGDKDDQNSQQGEKDALPDEIVFGHVTFSYVKLEERAAFKSQACRAGLQSSQGRQGGAGSFGGASLQERLPGEDDELTNIVNIQDLSFRVKKGETLGIIGEIGSGKSTVLHLLMRIYDVDGGRVFIGGKDVRSYERHNLQEKFGVVFQNDALFEDSISGNVSLGR